MLEKPGPQPWAPDIQSRALQFLKGETGTGNALAGLVFQGSRKCKESGRGWEKMGQNTAVSSCWARKSGKTWSEGHRSGNTISREPENSIRQ